VANLRDAILATPAARSALKGDPKQFEEKVVSELTRLLPRSAAALGCEVILSYPRDGTSLVMWAAQGADVSKELAAHVNAQSEADVVSAPTGNGLGRVAFIDLQRAVFATSEVREARARWLSATGDEKVKAGATLRALVESVDAVVEQIGNANGDAAVVLMEATGAGAAVLYAAPQNDMSADVAAVYDARAKGIVPAPPEKRERLNRVAVCQCSVQKVFGVREQRPATEAERSLLRNLVRQHALENGLAAVIDVDNTATDTLIYFASQTDISAAVRDRAAEQLRKGGAAGSN
jgi:hypothetical protein